MSRKGHLPDFSDEIKKHWIVRRDVCGDEYIALNGKNALGKKPLRKGSPGKDHIYLISKDRAGLWISGVQVQKKVNAIQKKVPSLMIEQIGDGEAVVSVPVNDLHELCKAARAKRRKQLTEDQRQRLRESNPIARMKKNRAKSALNVPKIDEHKAKDS
jgi:hypothetical protein